MTDLSENLADLFVFVKVVESKSFSEAARLTGSTKSTVSKRIRRLEEALGAKLLNRTTRHLALTEAGHSAYQHGLRITEETAALRSAVDGLQSTPRGHLRVTTSVAFGNLHLTGLIAQFMAIYPDVSVDLALNDRYVDVVDEGFDIAIRLTSKPVETFVARRLATIDYVACATPEYLRTHAPISSIDALASHECVRGGPAQSTTWRFTSSATGAVSEIALGARLSVNSSESVRVAVLAGAGIGLLPTFAIAADLAAGRLNAILPEYEVQGPFGNSVYAVFSPSRFVAPKMRVFVDFLVARFQDGSTTA